MLKAIWLWGEGGAWKTLGVWAINSATVAAVLFDHLQAAMALAVLATTLVFTFYQVRLARKKLIRTEALSKMVERAQRACALAQNGECPVSWMLREMDEKKL
jgi:hypothetical protein